MSGTTKPTKRNVLQAISRFFDPLGFLGPFIIKLKILFQDIWKRKLGWDEELTGDLLTDWESCYAEIGYLRECTMSRCVWENLNPVIHELHVFSDSSLNGYGAVAYIRTIGECSQITVRFFCAKNRVAPLKENDAKELTLPRLELTAALIAARLTSYIIQGCQLQFERIHLWTDSKIALCWILGDVNKWKPYVANRVQEIKRLTADFVWGHCPGKDNPADLLTRGVTAKILANSTIWRNGPEWLKRDSNTWPNNDLPGEMPNSVTALQIVSNSNEFTSSDSILPLESLSSWKRLLRVTAYVLRFADAIRRRSPNNRNHVITAEEMDRAEIYWLKYAQRTEYQNEINDIHKGNPINRSSSLLTLNPILDEKGLLRVNSRLRGSEEEKAHAYPIILPKRSIVSRLIVEDSHRQLLHSGLNTVLADIRTRYWILKARQLVKAVISRCLVCKRMLSKPTSQPFAPLPRDSMQTSRPFDTTGIDFAGPLYVKGYHNDETSKKIYILLRTCGAVRAIHLELVPDLTAECCLLALRRFIARRGRPRIIYSDNAKTFKRASKELTALTDFMQDEKLHGFLANRGIRWKYIVERAPWWGGFWERLVRSVKNLLKTTIMGATLNSEELQTLLVEVENVINSRPLTYVSEDPLDLSPVTPSHIIMGLPSNSLEPDAIIKNQPDSKEIRQRWNSRLKSLKFFWTRWKVEYLHQLGYLHHNFAGTSSSMKRNDVVLVKDNLKPRLHWKLALIEEVFPGRDGKVRACQLRLPNGTKLRRPVQLLYPMELCAGEDVKNVKPEFR